MAIKILHTSDWHLGKKLMKRCRLEEQQLFLSWLHNEILENEIDGLIIAGDIFDTPNPPADAIRLFYDFLHNLSLESGCQTFIIGGNHDSGRLLNAPKNILRDKNIHIAGLISDKEDLFFNLQKGDESVSLSLLPYFRSYELAKMAKEFQLEQSEEIQNEETNNLSVIEHLFEEQTKSMPDHNIGRLLVAHHLFGNFEEIEMGGSEQVIALSGLNTIPLSIIKKHFDYVALGHIHRRQTIKQESPLVYYCGAPIQFRFGEHAKKSVATIEFNKGEEIKQEIVDIPNARKVIQLKTDIESYKSDLQQLIDEHHANKLSTFLETRVSLKCPQVGLADEIREMLAETSIDLLCLVTDYSEGAQDSESSLESVNGKLPELKELFELFYYTKHPDSESIPDAIQEEFIALIDEVAHKAEVINESP